MFRWTIAIRGTDSRSKSMHLAPKSKYFVSRTNHSFLIKRGVLVSWLNYLKIWVKTRFKVKTVRRHSCFLPHVAQSTCVLLLVGKKKKKSTLVWSCWQINYAKWIGIGGYRGSECSLSLLSTQKTKNIFYSRVRLCVRKRGFLTRHSLTFRRNRVHTLSSEGWYVYNGDTPTIPHSTFFVFIFLPFFLIWTHGYKRNIELARCRNDMTKEITIASLRLKIKFFFFQDQNFNWYVQVFKLIFTSFVRVQSSRPKVSTCELKFNLLLTFDPV